MFHRITIASVICIIAIAAALPSTSFRDKRDVMDSMKNAWGEVVKTFSDAGDAVVHVFKPTEKSTIDKMVDALKPTEKSTIDKIADSVKGLTQ